MKKKRTAHQHREKYTKKGRADSSSYAASAVIFLVLSLVAIVGTISFVQTILQAASLQYDSPKKLVSTSPSNVLGDDDEAKQEEKKQEESQKKVEDEQKEESKRVEEQRREEMKKTEQRREASIKATTISSGSMGVSGGATAKKATGTSGKSGQVQETEIETVDGRKVKTNIEDYGTTKIEVEHGELKIKYVFENGQVVKKVEDDDGNEVDLKEDELEEVENEIEDELGNDDLEISTKSGRPAIVQNNTTAETEFPLSVDVGTNQLVVTTPDGQHSVTVLPEQAIQNILATGIMNRISDSPSSNVSDKTGSFESQSVIQLKVRDSKPVYEIVGEKTFKMFAFIPVTRPVVAVISAETGAVVTTQQSFFTNMVDLLSP